MSEKTPLEVESTQLLSGLLDTMVPPTSITVTDIYGNEYTLKSRVSARVQIQIGREFEKALEGLDTSDLFGDVDGGVAAMVRSFMSLATQENVMDGLDNCFRLAHATAFSAAVKAAKKDKSMVKNPAAVDLFALEDILGGVLPLFLGLIQKGAGILTKIAQNQ